MLHWTYLVAILGGWLIGTIPIGYLLIRRLRQHAELTRIVQLARNIIREKSIPIDVEINQDLPISLSGTYTLPADLQLAVHMDDPIDIDATVPLRARIPVDTVVESSILRFGTIKVPIQGEIPVEMDVPVRTRAQIRSEQLRIRLKEPLQLDLPNVVVPLRARLRVNIPLQLPELEENGSPALQATAR